MRPRLGFIVLMALTCATTATSPAAAEWFLDSYVGAALTPREDATATGTLSGAAVDVRLQDLRFETGISTGLRLGYWWESLRLLGAGLDLSYFNPELAAQTFTATGTLSDPTGRLLGAPLTVAGVARVTIPRDDVHVIAIAPELMLRWPLLVSPQFPTGRLQPYVLAGPAMFISYVGGFDVQFSPGLKAGGGVAWQIVKDIAVFAEYQFTHFRPDYNSTLGVQMKLDIDTNHLVGGLSLRF
jgi:opacity protein-like surface antigen